MTHKELEYEYTAKLGERQELATGSVKYPLKVICEDKDEVIVDTTYTISKKQEDDLERMVRRFAEKRGREHEHDIGQDHSNKEINI